MKITHIKLNEGGCIESLLDFMRLVFFSLLTAQSFIIDAFVKEKLYGSKFT